jgi:hypothetical protein
MLHAMLEFTVSLLVQRPPANIKPISAHRLRERLLALHDPDSDYELSLADDCDLEIIWVSEPAGAGASPGGQPLSGDRAQSRFSGVSRGASRVRLRFLLDEQRHELRANQVSRTYYYVFGLQGWVPRIGGVFSVQSGPPDQFITQDINQVARRAGWSVRPVIWWFQATTRGFDMLQALTPAPLRRWPARRFWGVVYPLSYLLAIAYLVAVIGPLDRQDWLLLVGVSAAWWGVWGFLVWALVGFPAFWRRKSR